MQKYKKSIVTILALVIFLVSVLGSVLTSAFEEDFYTKSQIKYNVAQKINLSQKQVTEATTVALLYTKGVLPELEYKVDINNQKVDLYSSQDKEHMIDVKNLYTYTYYVFVGLSVVLFASIIIMLFKRKVFNVFYVTSMINKVSLYAIITVVMIGLFALANFNQFWTFFHKIFFRNDLWLMYPDKDLLINLMPGGLFKDLVFKIIFRFSIIFGLVNLTAYLYRYNVKKGVSK